MSSDGRCVHARRPLQWLLSEGHDVLFVDGVNPLPAGAERMTHRTYPRYPGTGMFPRMMGKKWGARASFAIHHAHLRRLMRSFRADVAHIQWIDTRAWHFARAGIRPLVLTSWGSDINRFNEPDHDPVLREQVACALRAADHVIADAPDILRQCRELAGRDLATTLMPIGIDTSRFTKDLLAQRRAWREALHVEPDAFVFGSMRAWVDSYNHDLILEAFARSGLPRRGCYLLFKVYHPAGYDRYPEYLQRVTAMADRMGVSDRIRWIHDVSDEQLPEIYATVDAVVNWPRIDAFPVHFLEAAAAKKVIVSCGHPSYEWSFAGTLPFMVKPCSVDALGEALVRAVETHGSPSVAAMLDKATSTVVSEFDEGVTKQRLVNVYEDLRH
jgi:glycosyltransferase involved in cell wall biosynthesis